ncbi:MAG TPA: GFA family protein [Devosiaceae bacterium]
MAQNAKAEVHTGGCQCGAVRFRLQGPLVHASICNCRMCQKAFGNFFAPFANAATEPVWTRGKPAIFRSSERAERGFCPQCGTPLTYRWGDEVTALAIGAFDHPNEIVPTIEFAHENRHPFLNHIADLKAEPLGLTDEERDILAILKSFQHPDRDTDTWPVNNGGEL